MVEVFEAKERLLKSLGWVENPFVKDLRSDDAESFMKYYCPFEAKQILEKLAFDSKACLLFGPKGVGKTSALTFVGYSLPEKEFSVIQFKEPPQSIEDLAVESGFARRGGGLLSIFTGGKDERISRQELVNRIKRVGKKVVFFIDEAHLEKNHDMYMEFKYLLDDVSNLRLVISALGREGFPDSLIQLIGDGNIFQRKHFTEKEMREIVDHRIRAVGGKPSKPFPEAFLKKVFTEQNLLSPRYVFDELNGFLADYALGKGDWKGVAEYAGDPLVEAAVSATTSDEKLTKSHADWWISLSPSQQVVMDLLLRNSSGQTLSEIMVQTKLSQNTAFNALYQLRGDDAAELERKPNVPFPLVVVKPKAVGGRKKNLYFVSPKVRNIFTMH